MILSEQFDETYTVFKNKALFAHNAWYSHQPGMHKKVHKTNTPTNKRNRTLFASPWALESFGLAMTLDGPAKGKLRTGWNWAGGSWSVFAFLIHFPKFGF